MHNSLSWGSMSVLEASHIIRTFRAVVYTLVNARQCGKVTDCPGSAVLFLFLLLLLLSRFGHDLKLTLQWFSDPLFCTETENIKLIINEAPVVQVVVMDLLLSSSSTLKDVF